MTDIYIEIGILAGLLILSGFFAAAEMALFSIGDIKVHQLVQQRVRGAKVVQALKNEPQELLITLLFAITIINIFAASFATSIAISLFKSNAIAIATGGMTFLLLIFGEIIPKSFAATHNQKISILCARPIQVLRYILFPFIAVLKVLVHWVSGKKTAAKISEAEIRTAASLGFEMGVVEKDEKEMIENVFKLNDTFVRQMMTPLSKTAVISVNANAHEALQIFKKEGFSRMPVYEKKKKNLIGLIHIKDVLSDMEKKDFSLRTMMFDPLYCDATERADHLLHRFRNRQQHFAFVEDHLHRVVGIVTLEDVLEELVGEIEDESDSENS